MDFELFLQSSLHSAEYFFQKPSPASHPFDNKYKSRKILEDILSAPSLQFYEDSSLLSAYVHYLLGVNFLETEETSQGETLLKQSLFEFSQLETSKIKGFLNIFQDIYNCLGLLFLNREEIELGMGCLAKSEEIYEAIREIKGDISCVFHDFANEKPRNSELKFAFFKDLGINSKKTESLYTLTQFYLAQAYTKLELKEKAAFYCGNTMKRQYESKQFVLKEWCVNAISLAEFYQNNRQFAQGFYLLQAGDSLIPPNKRKKLKATFQMSIARLFGEFLTYMTAVLQGETTDFSAIYSQINKKSLFFENMPAKFVELDVPKDYEALMKVFRQANTQYKKALSLFVLDGYVTEHVEMTQEISNMLKHLLYLEKDGGKRMALLEKRKDLLEPVHKQLNPKAYPGFVQKLLVELAEIYNEMFENRFNEYFLSNNSQKPKKIKLDAMNNYGFMSIKSYEEIEKILMEQEKEQKEKSKELCQSIINTRFNIAKAYNKIYGVDKRERVEYMKKSLENYRFIVNFIKELQKNKGTLDWNFAEQVKICQEMVELIPSKIDKIMNESI